MFNIEKFLDKFSKNIKSTEINKRVIIETIKKYISLDIPLDHIEIIDYIIHIKSSPAVLNKIFIYKQKIIEEINSKISLKIIDIK